MLGKHLLVVMKNSSISTKESKVTIPTSIIEDRYIVCLVCKIRVLSMK